MSLIGVRKAVLLHPPARKANFDADAQAIFDAFTTPPNDTRKGLINDLVVALKADGVWSKLDALYVHAAADSQAAKVNWKSPGTFDETEVNSPSFTADVGFQSNGSTSYLDSGFNPATASSPNFLQNDAHIAGWSLTSGAFNGSVWGRFLDPTTMIIQRFSDNTTRYRVSQSASTGIANTDGTGFYVASRTGATVIEGYKNGSSVVTGSTSSGAPSNGTFLCGANGVGDYPTVVCPMWAFGGGLTDQNVADYYSAVAAYLTGAGAI